MHMEPMDDRELNQLLRQWEAPGAPPHLRPPVRPTREPWWRWFVTGTVRVPVPVGLAAAAALAAVWMYSAEPSREPVVGTQPTISQPVVTLADFQPVDEVEVRVVGDVK
jgi:hypothetical protein